MVYVCCGIIGHKKMRKSYIYDNTDGPRGYYAKQNNLEIMRDFISKWNVEERKEGRRKAGRRVRQKERRGREEKEPNS